MLLDSDLDGAMNSNFKYKLNPISEDELRNLSNEDLCERMEEILINILYETYTDIRVIENFPRQSINDFFKTKMVQSLSQEHQRKVLRKCFEYLIQHEYLSRIGGWSGAIESTYNSQARTRARLTCHSMSQ